MIIPIRCFTCGKPIAHLWEDYLKKISESYNNKVRKGLKTFVLKKSAIEDMKNSEETIEKKVLDEMNMKRYCCRRMFLTHVDLCDKI